MPLKLFYYHNINNEERKGPAQRNLSAEGEVRLYGAEARAHQQLPELREDSVCPGGEGNCLYCGKLVTRPDGLFIDDTTTYFPSLTPEQQQQVSAERSRAIQHKNRLIERDKTQGQQNIFDEQLDYYEISENKWLDQEDRQHAIDKILAKGNLVET